MWVKKSWDSPFGKINIPLNPYIVQQHFLLLDVKDAAAVKPKMFALADGLMNDCFQ